MKILIVAIAVLVPAVAGAHEIGTTDVRLTIDAAGHWSAAITTGPQALLNKLEAEAGQPLTRGLDAPALQQHLEALLPAIASHLDVRFDGVRSAVTVAIGTLEVPADVTQTSFVVLSAEGVAPGGSRTVAWSDSLIYSTYALVLERNGQPPQTTWIEGSSDSGPLDLQEAEPATRLAIIEQYLLLGFEHILPRGVDHILFVIGMFLLSRSLRSILVQVTSFTLAHSLTLGLTMYGVVSLSPRIVEPLIALSIAYVAIENVLTDRLTPWRPAVVFAFGLLHGMGFAGVLRTLRLPRTEFIPALVSFNVGIELAQLTVIAAAFACTAMWYRDRLRYRARVVVPASAMIALTALVWTVERVVRF